MCEWLRNRPECTEERRLGTRLVIPTEAMNGISVEDRAHVPAPKRRSRPHSERLEMTSPVTSTDPLVEALATRARRMDLLGWQRIASWAEQFELSFENLRVLLAMRIENGPTAVNELAELSGLSLHAAYPATQNLRGRGYLHEERRRYVLTEHGQDLIATLDAAHRDGIRAYVDDLAPEERQRLDEAFGTAREDSPR
jgi:DNA-binding MarR family transcriptional regulator